MRILSNQHRSAILALAALLALPTIAAAQGRGRAVPRGSVRGVRPQIVRVVPYRPSFYRPYRPGVGLGFGYPGYWGPNMFRYTPPFGYGSYGYGVPFGYGSYGYGVPFGYAPYGYGASGYVGRPYGGVRIDLPQRDAEVWVDNYFVGIVNDFDGGLQQANLEAGPHHIEVREEGFETISFDVNVEPGRTITYRASMRPLQP